MPASAAPKSPFFKPSSTPHVQATETVTSTTPRGTRTTTKRSVKRAIQEHKATMTGCTANLMNAIIGSGIVGMPYAIMNAGFVAGVCLIVFTAFLTDKSLRLLIATAKHANTPSYETLAEAAFGTWGFGFISINMFIMAYGAMLSYLMIVKDTFSVALGVSSDDLHVKRAFLCVISLLVIVPLSSQRDMADLAKTSRISVVIDALLVFVVAFQSHLSLDRIDAVFHDPEWLRNDFWIHTDTIFVGLGVLSFAFVCQHSAFIIAGSLDRPTTSRWSKVTGSALSISASLALLCGVSGYLGYLDNTKGNVINNLGMGDLLSNIARAMLGTTMLFVYPMESFVARHICVVLLFEGRRAHEGEDTSILARRDRRYGLTFALYLSALLPAVVLQDLGNVLSVTGAIAGSCLSYIGPGAIYLGIHGDDFLCLIRQGDWWRRFVENETNTDNDNAIAVPASENTTLLPSGKAYDQTGKSAPETYRISSFPVRLLQSATWYLLLFPAWCWIARIGARAMAKHEEDVALQTPHSLRIGAVAPDTPQFSTRKKNATQEASEYLSLSWREGAPVQRLSENLSQSWRPDELTGGTMPEFGSRFSYQTSESIPQTQVTPKTTSLDQQIAAKLIASHREQQRQHVVDAVEKDPQKAPPTALDFVVAIFLIFFGIIALSAGLVSIGLQAENNEKMILGARAEAVSPKDDY